MDTVTSIADDCTWQKNFWRVARGNFVIGCACAHLFLLSERKNELGLRNSSSLSSLTKCLGPWWRTPSGAFSRLRPIHSPHEGGGWNFVFPCNESYSSQLGFCHHFPIVQTVVTIVSANVLNDGTVDCWLGFALSPGWDEVTCNGI